MIVEALMAGEDTTTEIDMIHTEEETLMMMTTIKSILVEVKCFFLGKDFEGVNFLMEGTYRIMSNGRDVEMTCEFPGGSNLISNVIWERADRGYNNYRRYHN